MNRKFIIRSIAFVMLYVAAASYIFQNEVGFFIKQDGLDEEFNYSLKENFQELNIPINSEVNLHALRIKHENPKVMVLFFSAGDDAPNQLNESQQYYYQLGYDVIIPDYRGNGKSTGKYESEEDFYRDALQWMKMTVSLADSLPVWVVGQAFGSGIAAEVYTHQLADLLILEEPYYAWNDIMLRKYFWWLPHSYFTKFKIPTWKYIRASSRPIVIIHPTESKNISFKNSELLLEFFKPGDQLISLQGEKIDHTSEEFIDKFDKIKKE